MSNDRFIFHYRPLGGSSSKYLYLYYTIPEEMEHTQDALREDVYLHNDSLSRARRFFCGREFSIIEKGFSYGAVYVLARISE